MGGHGRRLFDQHHVSGFFHPDEARSIGKLLLESKTVFCGSHNVVSTLNDEQRRFPAGPPGIDGSCPGSGPLSRPGIRPRPRLDSRFEGDDV